MSNFEHDFTDCRCQKRSDSAITMVIHPRERDLGGFSVRRCLPASEKTMVGPFIFFDHLGPAEFPAGEGIDVRPHPHINLATVTYLFEGEILHRDSLGNVQSIKPGDINWMTAGRGIVHSERTPPQVRTADHKVHALQLWVALPTEQEEIAPEFTNYPANTLPSFEKDGLAIRVMVGKAYGLHSPVKTLAETLYVDISIAAGQKLQLPGRVTELAGYLVSGSAYLGHTELESQAMTILNPATEMELTASLDSRLVLIGGEPLGERHIWWNFVSSRPERIEQAKADWQDSKFKVVPDEKERIPLPKN